MKTFTVYDATGAIFQVMRQDSDGPPGLLPGHFAIPGEGKIESQYVSHGKLRDYTPEELEAKKNLPLGWVWVMPDRKAVDMREINHAREQAWNRIKGARAAAENGTFVWDNSVFQINRAAIPAEAMTANIAKANGQPYSNNWKLANNSHRQVNADDMIAINVAQAARIKQIHDIAENLLLQINDTVMSTASLDAINWPVEN